MKKLHNFNLPFLVCFLLFFLLTTIALVLVEKGDLVLFFSGNRTIWGDFFFKWITHWGDGLLIVAVAILFLFYRFRLSIALACLGLSVMLISFISKSIFSLDRPLPYFQKRGLEEQLSLVAGVDVHTGATSFPSGHTMAAFALFAFLSFILVRKKWLGIIFFTLALLVGLSRVYLAQHFLQDVYLGSLLGVGLAMFWAFYQKKWQRDWLDSSLRRRKHLEQA